MQTERRTYTGVAYWQQYQRFFPAEFRCDGEHLPREEWWSWRGIDVHIDRYERADARLKLVVLHGAGGYGRMVAPYARIAANLGYETVAPDLPGYGLTRPGRPVSFADWVACASDLVASEIARDGRPVVLFGASMGGMLAYAAAANSDARGLIVTCLLDPRRPEVREGIARFPALARAGLPLMRTLAPVLDPIGMPIAWLSKMSGMANDPDLNALAARDPYGGGNSVSLRFLRTYLEWGPAVEPEAFDTCPVLMVHPAADRWTPLAISRPFFERLPAAKQLVELENCGHMPVEEPGFSQLVEAMRAFLASLLEPLTPLDSVLGS